MKYWIVRKDDKYYRIGHNKTPTGYEEVYPCPAGVEDGADVQIVDVDNGVGDTVKEAQLDQSAKDARLAAGAIKAADKAWADLRSERDVKLLKCDWTQGADSPLTTQKKAEWATYRQELRDLPANTVDPTNPSWPTKPE